MSTVNALGISHVVFTGDLLRPFPAGNEWESATWKNIRWLQALIAPHLNRLGITQRSLTWDPTLDPARSTYFDTPALYDRLGMPLGMASWTQLATQQSASPTLVEQLAPQVEGALVIGYEMPDPMLDALNTLGVPYIDVALHAVRFMPDLIFGMRTNHTGLHESLACNRVNETDIAIQAGDIRAKAAWMRPPVEPSPGSMVVFGQVHGDRSLVKDGGGFVSLADSMHELIGLCHTHSRTYFKPHPYDMQASPSQQAVQQIGSMAWTDANAYLLMAQECVETVVAINSSCLIEARYFGKKTISFKPFLYDYDARHAPSQDQKGSIIAQTPSWLKENFWRALMNLEVLPTLQTSEWTPDRLRKTMNADWGYGQINKVVA